MGAMNLLATVALDQGRLEDAEKGFQHLLELRRADAGTDDDPNVLGVMSNLGQTYLEQERYEDAERVTADALTRARRVLGNEHRETLNYVNNLAMAKRRLGKMEEAGALYEEGYATTARIQGETAPSTLISRVNLGSFYAKSGRCAEQAAFLDETVEVCRKHSLPDTPNLGMALRNIAQCRAEAGQTAEAERAYLAAEKELQRVLPPENTLLLTLHGALAKFYEATGRAAEAQAWKRRAEPAAPVATRP
jgi:tetratricopeptide (TPR) repeat protein